MLQRANDRVSKYSMGMRQRLGVAACLIGDPQLLILDEPMNGLDPAGMHEMRDMILSLVAEGRTVVLSSHLLDEVERTCDAVAIVDRGNIIRQGPISELLAGASVVLQVECSEPDRARSLLGATGVGADIEVSESGLGITSARLERRATSSQRSTASSSKEGYPCTGSRRSKPRSNPGSCRSRAGWGLLNDQRERAGPDPAHGHGPAARFA
jgi:ABC-type multidrug transport system ATPase subunit